MKAAVAVAKINLQNSRLALNITGAVLLLGSLNYIINPLIVGLANASKLENATISFGHYAWIFLLLFAIFTPALHFQRFMNLNVKRTAYIQGCALSYVPVALALSAFNLLIYLTVDKLAGSVLGMTIWNLIDLFGWSSHGLLVAFVQQSAFLLLVAVTLHTLTTVQSFWYGKVADVIIVAIISVFTPIAPLRAALVWFLQLLIFHPNALVQISACLLASAVIYALSIVPVKHKRV